MPRLSTRRRRGEPDPPTILVTPGEAAPHDCEWQSAREFERQRTGRALVGGSSPTLLTSHAHRSAPRVRGATRAALGSRSWSGVGLALVSQASQTDVRGSHLNACILSSEDRIEPRRATLFRDREKRLDARACTCLPLAYRPLGGRLDGGSPLPRRAHISCANGAASLGRQSVWGTN